MVDFSDNLRNDSIVLLHVLDEDSRGILQTNNFLGRNAKESLLVLQLDIRTFHPKFIAELDRSATALLFLGEKRQIEHLFLMILYNQLNRVEDGHSPRRMRIKILPYLILKHSKIDIILIASPSHTNGITKIIDSLSRISSSSHTINGQDPRIVPSCRPICEDQLM